ncbi:uncharacterized protein LOC113147634 [Cyclospora cayetanensis]|uniref:Uncharacterized protein LOC113147634 n=1 Tax=Cyclospora cayetanensis TaxID=88456 RepID=A0A6P6S5F8_9EIME|nr:uncharacterized protein LOC113147634 [Cyclospora cayetanensis]
MEGLGDLDAFIAGCDATKISAFVEHVHRRFSEAQAQKQKKVETVLSTMHEQLLQLSAGKKVQLNSRIKELLASLNKRRDNAAEELARCLDSARAKKQSLVHSFQEQEKACQVRSAMHGIIQELEREMKELTQEYTIRQQELGPSAPATAPADSSVDTAEIKPRHGTRENMKQCPSRRWLRMEWRDLLTD